MKPTCGVAPTQATWPWLGSSTQILASIRLAVAIWGLAVSATAADGSSPAQAGVGRLAWVVGSRDWLPDPVWVGGTMLVIGLGAGWGMYRFWRARYVNRQSRFVGVVIEAMPCAVYVKNAKGVYLGCNAAFATMLGRSKEQIVGRTAHDLLPQADADFYRSMDTALLRKPGIQSYEGTVTHADGTRRDVLFTKASFVDPEGGGDAIVGVILDLTSRKRAESELRSSEERFRAFFQSPGALRGIVQLIDQDLLVLAANGAAAAFVNCPPGLVEGHRVSEYLPGDLVKRWRERCLQCQTSRQPLVYEFEYAGGHPPSAASPPRHFRVNLTSLGPDPAGQNRFSFVATEITDLRVAEARLRTLNTELELRVSQRTAELEASNARLREQQEELERSNRDLEQFAYVASHDLQEPLRLVTGYVELLAQRYRGRLDPDADTFIGFALDAVERMRGLIRDLLAYSRVGREGHPRVTVDLNRVYQEAVANLRQRIDETGAEVTAGDLPTVYGRQRELVQVLQNLIGNGLKFHRGQPVRVSVSSRKDEEQRMWVIEIADNGLGIAREDFDRIFALFQRLHPREEYPGTGVGLALCQRIVEQHGGRIWVESEVGKGSTFHVALPIKTPDLA